MAFVSIHICSPAAFCVTYTKVSVTYFPYIADSGWAHPPSTVALGSVLSWPSAVSGRRQRCITRSKSRHFKQGSEGNADLTRRYEIINYSVCLFYTDMDLQSQ